MVAQLGYQQLLQLQALRIAVCNKLFPVHYIQHGQASPTAEYVTLKGMACGDIHQGANHVISVLYGPLLNAPDPSLNAFTTFGDDKMTDRGT